MKIVGIVGLAGSGKDTVGNILEKNGFQKLSFAKSLKDAISVIFHWDRELLEGSTPESRLWREQVDQWWADKLNIPHLTPRWILQYWGTDLCRNNFHKDIWIISLERYIRSFNENAKIVITDCRFSNEIEMIKSLNGQIWEVYRPSIFNSQELELYNQISIQKEESLISQFSKLTTRHISEVSWLEKIFDSRIENKTTIEELECQVMNLLHKV